ncbi:MAG: FAD-dependent oxidoreductase, partial [Pirellulales bacterium]|nr:FAD-dependent oxidoreductase [Pirellulales bacterium]
MNATSNLRVAIVGGGLSGLATAVQLHLANPRLNFTLLEASPRLGGVIGTEKVGDFILDHGADMFATNPPDALELLQKIGVDDQLILPQEKGRGARIVFRGRLVDLPDGFVLMRATKLASMLTTPLLSLRGKIRLLAERWIRPTGCQSDQDDLSVAEFVRHRLGQEVLQLADFVSDVDDAFNTLQFSFTGVDSIAFDVSAEN